MHELSLIFFELGAIATGLGILTRFAYKWNLSPIPLFLLAGLAFGNGGLIPLRFSAEFVHVVAEIGVLLLLFMLGLEYTGQQLRANLRFGSGLGLVDFLLNFPPGVVAGYLLGWAPLTSVLLGGVVWISSSGVVAKILAELDRANFPETPAILSVLVLEDLAMAVFLPLIAVLLIGQSLFDGAISVAIALFTVGTVLLVSIRYGGTISRMVAHESDEVIHFTALGLMLLVAAVAQSLQVSAAIGAFLVGIAMSGPVVKQTHRQLSPLRDLFAAIFFLFFGLQIDPATLPPVLFVAIILALVTAATKMLSGMWAARRSGVSRVGQLRAGAALIARGEFSIVIAGLGVNAGLEPQLGSLSAAYVLVLASIGPILARTIEPLSAMCGLHSET